MENISVLKLPRILPLYIVLILMALPMAVSAQLSGNIDFTDNSNCNGSPCSYNGPSILINELMLSPNEYDGSMWGSGTNRRGEWIELYNPDICEPVDISCYYLGNNANDNSPYPGGYVIPPGTVVPPAGFALIRGINADPVPAHRLVENGGNVVELVVEDEGVCVGDGSRLWFPNAGGWFAFYDSDGVPQDAVSWGNQSNLGEYPCTPSLAGCGFSGTLANYNEFPSDRKNFILTGSAADHQGQSIRRVPDGGTWSGPSSPTYAYCNGICADQDGENCNGTATVIPQGGTPPYTYQWDDPLVQTTQTASLLCAGQYCVDITDADGNTTQVCVTVSDVEHHTHVEAAICEEGSYTLPDNTVVTEPGQYDVMLTTAKGCDSLVTVDLEVHPNFEIDLTPTICDNQSYTLPDGTKVNTTGVYVVTLQTIHGCDSTVMVDLTVNPPVDVSLSAEICPGDSYELPDGSFVSDEGTYQVLKPGGEDACDTLITVTLDHYPDFEIQPTVEAISCHDADDGEILLTVNGAPGPYTFIWSDGLDHGADATGLAPGNYQVEVSNELGCTKSVDIEITEPTPVVLTATADELICFGAGSDLSASATGGTGDFDYHWSHTSNQGPQSTVNPGENTWYTVHATDENNCSTDTLELFVEVISMHTDSLEVTSVDPVCQGESVVLQASYSGLYPPYTYTWSHGVPSGPGPHEITPGSSTDYTVTVTDDCGNEVSKVVPVVVWPLPTADLTTLEDISCHGVSDGQVEISVSDGTPGYSFLWSDGVDHGASANDLPAGDYQVQISDANSCSTEVSFQISEPAPLEISLTGEELICYGSANEILAEVIGGTGAYTYHWNNLELSGTGGTVQPQEHTLYSVYAKDENLCTTDTVEIFVTVINMYDDSLHVEDVEPICLGSEASLVAEYSGLYHPYTYTWSHGLPEGPGPHVVSPQNTTVYTVSVSDHCGNVVSQQIPVEVLPLPQVQSVDVEDISCHGLDDGQAVITLVNGGGAIAYNWSDSVNNGASGVNLTPGTHQVEIVDEHGCSTDVEIEINEPAPLELTLEGDDLMCIGSTIELQTKASGGTGEITLHWSHGDETTANVFVSPTEDATYGVFATDENGCHTEIQEIFVTVIDMDLGLLTTVNDTSICPGEEAVLYAFYSGDHPPYQFMWGEGVGPGAGPHVVAPTHNTTYFLTVSDQCGNEVSKGVTVTIFDPPVVQAPDVLLAGCGPLDIELYDPLNDFPGFVHEWIFPSGEVHQGNPTALTLEEEGIYEVTLRVTSPDGCTVTAEDKVPVEVYPSPVANFTASKWATEISDPEIVFTDAGQGFIFSEWRMEGHVWENQPVVTYAFADTGKYAMMYLVENEFGCRDSITKWVTIQIVHDVEIPNAFTPGAGGNPYYDPTSTSNTIFYPFAEYVQEYKMSIFNRWGELIFQSDELSKGWNGTYRDKPAPQDVYIYKIEMVYTDGFRDTKVGDLTLFR